MSKEFLKPSDKALTPVSHKFKAKYDFPFASVPVGMSFAVAIDEIKNINVLRTLASKAGKELGRVFKVINHGEDGFEIYFERERE